MTAGLTVDSKFQDFPGFSRTFSAFFQDFPGPGILSNKIPGLSRICTNPASGPVYSAPQWSSLLWTPVVQFTLDPSGPVYSGPQWSSLLWTPVVQSNWTPGVQLTLHPSGPVYSGPQGSSLLWTPVVQFTLHPSGPVYSGPQWSSLLWTPVLRPLYRSTVPAQGMNKHTHTHNRFTSLSVGPYAKQKLLTQN